MDYFKIISIIGIIFIVVSFIGFIFSLFLNPYNLILDIAIVFLVSGNILTIGSQFYRLYTEYRGEDLN